MIAHVEATTTLTSTAVMPTFCLLPTTYCVVDLLYRAEH